MTVQAARKPWSWLIQNCKRYIPVAYYMAVAQAKHEFAGTFGGILWWFGEPVIYTLLYYFVFSVVFNIDTENFIAFLMLGLVAWRWFSRAITSAAVSVSRSATLLRQVDIPKIIFPLEAVIVETYTSCRLFFLDHLYCSWASALLLLQLFLSFLILKILFHFSFVDLSFSRVFFTR
jgi:ABC-type polysaccharide/polyol phosphate export permease